MGIERITVDLPVQEMHFENISSTSPKNISQDQSSITPLPHSSLIKNHFWNIYEKIRNVFVKIYELFIRIYHLCLQKKQPNSSKKSPDEEVVSETIKSDNLVVEETKTQNTAEPLSESELIQIIFKEPDKLDIKALISSLIQSELLEGKKELFTKALNLTANDLLDFLNKEKENENEKITALRDVLDNFFPKFIEQIQNKPELIKNYWNKDFSESDASTREALTCISNNDWLILEQLKIPDLLNCREGFDLPLIFCQHLLSEMQLEHIAIPDEIKEKFSVFK